MCIFVQRESATGSACATMARESPTFPTINVRPAIATLSDRARFWPNLASETSLERDAETGPTSMHTIAVVPEYVVSKCAAYNKTGALSTTPKCRHARSPTHTQKDV